MSYQTGIFAFGNHENSYLEFDILPGKDFSQLVDALACLPALSNSTYGSNIVFGLRPSAWRTLHPEHTPADATDFSEDLIGLDGYTMPATQHDAWVWVAGCDRATVFDNALSTCKHLANVAKCVNEETGWVYKQSRDLTGFVDGSENPHLLQAPKATLVPKGQPGADSCVLLFQKWEHQTEKWHRLENDKQEQVIGRTKTDDTELDPKPYTAHISRTVIERDGEELEMLRRNVAYGTATKHGTIFVGFSQDQYRQARMLDNMVGKDGQRDAITYFTTPLSGAYYVIPSLEAIAEHLPEEEE